MTGAILGQYMRRLPLILVSALLPLLPSPAWSQESRPKYPAGALRALDGDTLMVRTADFKELKIQLYGVKAPKNSQPGWAEAKEALGRLQGQTVEVIEMDSALTALLEHEGRSVNLDLAAWGLVWFCPQNCQEQPICDDIQKAEDEARAAGLGIWADDEPVPPWEWRKKKK